MKVIIAGGRNRKLTENDFKTIDKILKNYYIEEIVSGGAKGTDSDGVVWAKKNNIPSIVFNANWELFGNSAGYIRNKQMADYADAVILFSGGKGTNNMRKLAVNYGLRILYDEYGELTQ